MEEDNGIEITRYALNNDKKRTITGKFLDLHMQYSDQDCHIGNGMVSETLSPIAISNIKIKGIEPSTLEKLKRVAIVYGKDGSVITVLQMYKGKGRRYARGSYESAWNH